MTRRGARRKQKGQVSIMVAMMMMTFILLFTFVVNIGMLVNAKINLQNAADVAAYAGAATQARLLNQISHLNYEMRRQYKKFLYRYYIFGNMAQSTFPKSGDPPRPRVWKPAPNQTDYGVPSVCMIFNEKDNYCQVQDLKPIQTIKANTLNAISAAAANVLTQMEQIRQDGCESIANLNLQVLLFWLYNTDKTLKSFADKTQNDPTIANNIGVIRVVAGGIGLVPREVLTYERIRTLQTYVNSPPASQINLAMLNKLRIATASNDPASKERTIQAFLSAYNTLGTHTFIDDTIEMDEFLPKAGDQANLLRLEPVRTTFDTWAQQYYKAANGTCEAKLVQVPVTSVPVGVVKDPKVLTYYAVRLKAKAKVLFSPFGEVSLKAYSAAQPFGSRIGPPLSLLEENAFTHEAAPPSGLLPSGTMPSSINGRIPNLPVVAEEGLQAARGRGWDNDFVVGQMFGKLWPPGLTPGVNPLPSVRADDHLVRGYHAAMVPNPAEGKYYNVINDLGNDPFVRNFDLSRKAAFWAPLVPPEKAAAIREEIKTELDQIFTLPPNLVSTKGITPQVLQKLKADLLIQLMSYIETGLPSGEGENGETVNVAVLEDPFTEPAMPSNGNKPRPAAMDPRIMSNEPAAVKTSWTHTLTSPEGRSGYSVKFVPFRNLLQKNISPNGGQDSWENGPQSSFDAEAQQDTELIQH